MNRSFASNWCWSARVWLVGVALALTACSSEPLASATPARSPRVTERPPTAAPSVAPSATSDLVELQPPPILTLDEVPLTCGSPLTFGVEALDTAPGAERADHPAARNLRQMMADGALPALSGWRLVVFNEQGALFLVPGTPSSGVDFWSAEFGPAASGWKAEGFGQCEIQPAFAGSEAARWEPAPGVVIGPDTLGFEALVFERACASGASPEGRIVGPAVVVLDDAVIVMFGTKPPPGPQTCLAGPPAVVRVQLPEPLGDRQLLDGSTFPPEPRP